jgi:uncharacterized protein
MDTLWIVLAIVFLMASIIGSVVPLLPGPPLAYVGLLLIQLKSEPSFSVAFMVIWAGIVVLVSLLDYLIPVYGIKKFGGTKYGMWGCAIGLVAGIWIGPWGIIFGPLAGAFFGELAGNNRTRAVRAAFGSFVGFLFNTLLKLIVCVTISWYVVVSLWF